ncbi:hypothetical protein [Bosea sp. BIWAKO-01]|uniref:hypothetical protein n=1 Tax=Bosea sp. BIWAKO-01 TaxID=506668 RepID=UPI000853ECBC|nr:hypothetical protein [Bosea sp. BIWAKO-01]GAU82930.1 hypothetical protein BIWAKO_02853 [Bosea sp. BIWAKO-01]
MSELNVLSFVESAELPSARLEAAIISAPPIDLNMLPSSLVAGNTLIDFSAAPSGAVRSGVSMALLFASRVADAAMREGDDEDDWLASYKTNLRNLGFVIPQSALSISTFKKKGAFVHKAIIPFLTIAFGGAGIGPVILAALNNLQEIDKEKSWITLFDRESRKFNTRETHYAAVNADGSETVIRHVVARLSFEQSETNVLFFRVTDTTAQFESATTTMSANNNLLAVLEPRLRQRMESEIGNFIAEART